MRADDLNLKELLELDPEKGTIRFAGEEAVICDALSYRLLREELTDAFGETAARGVLTRFAYLQGRRMAEILKSKFEWENEKEWQKAGARILALQGRFMPDANSLESFGPEGGAWLASYEAQEQILRNGPSDKAVCWNLCGFISGYLSYSLGREIHAVEDQCLGKGDAVCHVMIHSGPESGGLNGETAVFKGAAVNDALQTAAETLKRMENELHEKTRELTNAMEGVAANTNHFDTADFSPQGSPAAPAVSKKPVTRLLKDVEKDCILSALEKTEGNRLEAAKLMGMGVATLYRKLKRYRVNKVPAEKRNRF